MPDNIFMWGYQCSGKALCYTVHCEFRWGY